MNSNFPDALARLIAANTKYTIAKQVYEDRGGYNWGGYAGWEYTVALNSAMEEFEYELNKVIDSRVKVMLEKMSEPQA